MNTPQTTSIVSKLARRRLPGYCFLVLLLAVFLGCGDPGIDTTYGQRTGVFGGKSINGTAVLGDMFEQAGHSVSSRSYLSPKLKEADVIVWFPDNFKPPTEKTRQWLTEWLEEGNHTLIYVGRDYDAAVDYWPEVLPRMPANQQAEGKLRATNAKLFFDTERKISLPDHEDAEWFSIDGKAKPRDVKVLDGPWADGIDATKANIKLNSRIESAEWAEALLETDDGDLIASREWFGSDFDDLTGASDEADSQLIIVANGSFLLNYSLINHEHRKLAGKLIGEVPEDAKVVFLEDRIAPGKGPDPEIVDEEPESEVPTGVEMFSVWPMNWVLVHLSILGAFFMLARWPIFGLPRSPKREAQADFGKHVAALAELLARTRDRGFAIARLQHYRQLVKKEPVEKPAPEPLKFDK
jgi:hypothetical protein